MILCPFFFLTYFICLLHTTVISVNIFSKDCKYSIYRYFMIYLTPLQNI